MSEFEILKERIRIRKQRVINNLIEELRALKTIVIHSYNTSEILREIDVIIETYEDEVDEQ